MKKVLPTLILVLFLTPVLANVAQPGMWNTGYGSRFTPLFPEDSINYGKIQMQKERVLINLYPGFAAVKGEYWMYNTTGKSITMNVGYPVNGSYSEDKIGSVKYDELYDLKVLINDKAATRNNDTSNRYSSKSNWYFWTTTFPPNALTKITVYFLTDNSKAHLRRGYNVDEASAFTYVLESGRAWAGKIESGEIYIQLNQGLTSKDIKGILPERQFKGDDTHLQLTFSNLEPYPANNILVWYKDAPKNFDFKTIENEAFNYFQQLANFPVADFNKPLFKVINNADFSVKDNFTLLFWCVVTGVILLVITLVALLIYFVYKLVKRLRLNKDSRA